MDNNNGKKVGQFLGYVVVSCFVALLVAATVWVIRWMFGAL